MTSKRAGLFVMIVCSLVALALFAQASINIAFEGQTVGTFPEGWKTRDRSNAVKVYTVQAEGGKKFLHADAQHVSVQISHEDRWALRDLPMLQWEWRAVVFPTGSNEREKSRADSVLGVYVVFGSGLFVRAIKYIWSDTIPAGQVFNSPYSSETRMVVVRSGRAPLNTWVTEKRDVLSDYRRLFGDKEENPVARGIALLTDSDNTGSRAVGDYGAITVGPAAPR